MVVIFRSRNSQVVAINKCHLVITMLVVCSFVLLWHFGLTEMQEVSSLEVQITANYIPAPYIPAPVEAYTLDHVDELGFNTVGRNSSSACDMWKNKDLPIHQDLLQYAKELDDYTDRVEAFKDLQEDVRILKERNPHACDTLKLHPDGLPGIFTSGQLSQTVSHGYVEPLLPPLRHPKCCLDGQKNGDSTPIC